MTEWAGDLADGHLGVLLWVAKQGQSRGRDKRWGVPGWRGQRAALRLRTSGVEEQYPKGECRGGNEP